MGNRLSGELANSQADAPSFAPYLAPCSPPSTLAPIYDWPRLFPFPTGGILDERHPKFHPRRAPLSLADVLHAFCHRRTFPRRVEDFRTTRLPTQPPRYIDTTGANWELPNSTRLRLCLENDTPRDGSPTKFRRYRFRNGHDILIPRI